ncbi:MAG: nitroreductase [Oscillibacter sp.]|nr:nitroreductase [Oscillibacter sp.]
MDQFYEMIYKRKSVRRYDGKRPLSAVELAEITAQLEKLQPLDSDIPVRFRIVKRGETGCLWGEYCLLLYSEERENYLANAGYLLEQMDLWFASRDIGACWYGMGRADEKKLDGLSFVIMMAFGRCRADAFRKSMSEAKRKPLSAVYTGGAESALERALQTAHYAPSACNSQPWSVVCEEGKLTVSQQSGFKNPLMKNLVGYMNKIDMGIFFCFLELALHHEGYDFRRTLLSDGAAEYTLSEE